MAQARPGGFAFTSRSASYNGAGNSHSFFLLDIYRRDEEPVIPKIPRQSGVCGHGIWCFSALCGVQPDYVNFLFAPSCYNCQKKRAEMNRSKPIAASLIITLSLLAVQYAAAEGAAPSVLVSNINSSESMLDLPRAELQMSDEDEISRLLGLFSEARVVGTTEEADVLAKQIVEASIRSYGRDSKGTARALTNLANLQVSNDQNAAAIQNLSTAIDIIERVENNLSLDLISPLSALVAAEQQAGNIDLAQSAWNRAVHVSHVNLGPHNYQQIETLYSLARLLARAGENKAANRMRRRISYLQTRETVAPRGDMLPGLEK
jgi:hypothetical protein